MENKNFIALTEDELYEVNGGGSRQKIRDTVGAVAGIGGLVIANPILGVVSVCCAADYLAETYLPHTDDIYHSYRTSNNEVVAGGYHFTTDDDNNLSLKTSRASSRERSSSSSK